MSTEPADATRRILPQHTPLPRPTSATSELSAFLQQRFQPEMHALVSEYRSMQAGAIHRGDLFRFGHRAAGFKMEVSGWLAEASRLLQESYSDYLKQVSEQGLGDEVKTTVAAVQNEAKKHVSAYQKAVDTLKYAREDLRDMLQYCRESLRALTEEDYLDRAER